MSPKNRLDLEGRWVLVTGASSGIGEAFARAFAARGANIVAVARREEKLRQLASRLATRVEVISGDLQRPHAASWLLGELESRNVEVDHLVNNAGVGGGGHFAKQDGAQLVEMFQLNCVLLTQLTRAFLPRMLEKNQGGIIQVASLAGFVPTPYMAAYGATKAFVLSLTSALVEEIRDSSVRMLAVCPGSVPTEFQARAGYAPVDNGATRVVSAEKVAAVSLTAYERGRHIVVPGASNAAAAFLSRFGSPELNARVSGIAMKRAGRHRIGER
jgi:uncharacterized protein